MEQTTINQELIDKAWESIESLNIFHLEKEEKVVRQIRQELKNIGESKTLKKIIDNINFKE